MDGNLRELRDVGLPCAKCTVKHLRSAVSRILADDDRVLPTKTNLWLSRAVVAIGEYAVGYRYHKDYAVGCLVAAEDESVANALPDRAMEIRRVRVGYSDDGASEAETTVRIRNLGCSYVFGHLEEALRECPREFTVQILDIIDSAMSGCAESVVQKILPVIEDIEETIYKPGIPEKGGEDTMACCKKGKGKCAAQKGGKAATKKACGKKGCK